MSFDAKAFLQNLSSAPGVYRMYDDSGTVIYVGKAKNLHRRVSSYFRKHLDNKKTTALVSHIDHIEVTIVNSETESLILEQNLIKKYHPKYNVLLRDDKSYPYILITKNQHPRIMIHRGAKRRKGDYFGPYPDAGAVRESLHLLQKLFPIRQCEDSMYANRSRPCLMYQIGRCFAPCVKGLISDAEYQAQVEMVKLFLQGKDRQVINNLVKKMEQASTDLAFEQAAKYRDQIQALRKVQEQQFVSGTVDDLDVIGTAFDKGLACIHVLFIRAGKILGSRSYFPQIPLNTDIDEILFTFLGQFYLSQDQGRILPSTLILDRDLQNEEKIMQASLSKIANKKIALVRHTRGVRAKYQQLATTNAKVALVSRLNHKMTIKQRFELLEKTLGQDNIERMECFDISHTMGERTVASCVVFNQDGPVRSQYRRYNIEGITGGDDYAAMGQVLQRRYSKQIDPDKIPDIIFIDGGKGQLNRAHQIVTPLMKDWPKKSLLIGIAKGESRKPGLETLVLISGETFNLPEDSPALHLIQHIRDESHDHAISGHRARRAKARKESILETIEGVGPKRRQSLLKYMGGLQALKSASISEIEKVPGISHELAIKIHDIFIQ